MDNIIILLKEIDEVLQAISPMKIRVKQKDLIKFYEITQDSEDHYVHDGKEAAISPGYFLTLLAPMATKVMVSILGHQSLPKIRGVIHSKSEINFFKSIAYGVYNLWSRVETLQKKKGKTGNYLVLTFRMSLLNEKEEEVANDIHQFFLRVKEDDN
ncbi:MAG: hypothetical protein HWN66_03025 [Candidatus Helarchaeota archaeon]|nr:hypothetical protein [Candidatus Helarchaeota archaeon]